VAAADTSAGDRFEAEISGLDDSGAGVTEIVVAGEPLRVHVEGALPGERVEALIRHRSVHRSGDRREAWAELAVVATPSPDRVVPVCPAYGACGGCALMHVSYPAQLAWKRACVQREFSKYPSLASVEVASCVPSPATTAYRNQAKYVYARGEKGDLLLGAYAPRSHDVVDLAGCRVVEPVLDDARGTLLGVLQRHQVEPFHEVRRTGTLRYAILRANRAGRVLATLVVARSDWAEAQGVADELSRQLPAVGGVVLNLNPAAGNALFGGEERVLVGEPTLEDDMGDVRVRLGSRSFFQANRAVGSRIYRDLAAGLPAGYERAVDAYAGAGGIALSLVALAKQVIAIEENAAATLAASSLFAEAGVGRPRVVTGDVAHGLAAVASADLVVLNPPRKGCAEEVLAQVRRLSPRSFAYLSCEPRTLARDLNALADAGLSIARVVPYDMMPHTPHVETLVIAARRV
jgi:23S rRNA (uracil1939-C5)-methyltransferase